MQSRNFKVDPTSRQQPWGCEEADDGDRPRGVAESPQACAMSKTYIKCHVADGVKRSGYRSINMFVDSAKGLEYPGRGAVNNHSMKVKFPSVVSQRCYIGTS